MSNNYIQIPLIIEKYSQNEALLKFYKKENKELSKNICELSVKISDLEKMRIDLINLINENSKTEFVLKNKIKKIIESEE